MRCSKAQRSISRRLDGALEQRLEAPLADHLTGCVACRAYADELARLEFDLLEVPEPTPDFTVRVMHCLDRTSARPRLLLRRPAVFRPVAAGLGIAAALSGFAIGSLLQLANGESTPAPNGPVEVVASDAIDPLGENSVESTLIAMLSTAEE
jgi:predicted anti-sigma-YlaC factor YlaD